MNINVDTAYEIGQKINENNVQGTVVRIELIIFSENYQDIRYVLDNGIVINTRFKSPDAK